MKKIEEILFSTLRSAMNNGNVIEPVNLSDDEWAELFALCKKQGVAAIVFEEIILHGNNMPFKIKMEWAFHADFIKKRHENQLVVTSHLSALLAEKNIRMMLLKGNGLALCYPHPECRECGDIDMYCLGNYDAVNQLITEKGVEIDHEDEKHSHFYFEGVAVENHRKMSYEFNHSNAVVSRELVKNFDDNPLVDERIPGVCLPALNINALYIMQHALNHLPWSGIPVRTLLDWMLYLKKNHDELDWAYLESIWKEADEMEIVSILTQICIDCLGMPKEYFHADIQYDKKNYKIIFEQIIHQWKESTATKNKICKLMRKIDQYERRKKAHYIVYKEPFPDSLFGTLSLAVKKSLNR